MGRLGLREEFDESNEPQTRTYMARPSLARYSLRSARRYAESASRPSKSGPFHRVRYHGVLFPIEWPPGRRSPPD